MSRALTAKAGSRTLIPSASLCVVAAVWLHVLLLMLWLLTLPLPWMVCTLAVMSRVGWCCMCYCFACEVLPVWVLRCGVSDAFVVAVSVWHVVFAAYIVSVI